MLDWKVITTTFGVVFFAQLPGKSSMTALVLAARNPLVPVLAGAALALGAHGAIAVGAGGVLGLLPARGVRVVAGCVFAASGLLMWPRGDARDSTVGEEATITTSRSAFGTAFALVFATEWGDLTQLATAALSARYHDTTAVFVGAVGGLWLATGIAALVGRSAGHLARPELIRRAAAVLFVLLGIAMVTGLA
jgi:putative Ca2+/H+ antiporter (TMEM165/GDT1 family)